MPQSTQRSAPELDPVLNKDGSVTVYAEGLPVVLRAGPVWERLAEQLKEKEKPKPPTFSERLSSAVDEAWPMAKEAAQTAVDLSPPNLVVEHLPGPVGDALRVEKRTAEYPIKVEAGMPYADQPEPYNPAGGSGPPGKERDRSWIEEQFANRSR